MNRAFQWYVCRTEMLSSFRIRIGNISPSATQWHFPLWKWRTKTPQNVPFSFTTWTPSNTAVPRPTARTTPNRSSDGWGTAAHLCRKVPIGYNGAPQIRPQSTPLRGPIPKLCLIPGPFRSTMRNGIRIRYAVFPQCTGRQTHVQPTDRQSDIPRSSTGKFDDYSSLRL